MNLCLFAEDANVLYIYDMGFIIIFEKLSQ